LFKVITYYKYTCPVCQIVGEAKYWNRRTKKENRNNGMKVKYKY